MRASRYLILGPWIYSRRSDALTRTLLYFCHYVLDPSLHTTLLQVYQNKVSEDRDVMMSWADAETTILQGKIEEISFDFYVRSFTFRRADNSTLRSWLVQAQNFLLAMGSKDLKLCERDKVAFVLRMCGLLSVPSATPVFGEDNGAPRPVVRFEM